MFRFLARLLGLVIGVSIVAGTASALAALSFKKKAPSIPDPASDDIDLVAVMDGVEFKGSGPSFRGGRVISWYAGVDVDLRDVTIDPAGAQLDVRTVFAGTRVVVAPGVPVRISGPAIFGGAMNSTDAPEPSVDEPGLEITGFTLFGGLQVIASERGEEIPGWAGERAPEHDGEHGRPSPALDVGADVTPA